MNNRTYIADHKCPRCGKLVYTNEFAVWCSSHGEALPWINKDEIEKGKTYETEYPESCGYMLMSG